MKELRKVASKGFYTAASVLMARYLRNDFVPQGLLSNPAWRRAAWVWFDNDLTGERRYPRLKTDVAALWTRAFLYFAFRCHYTKLNVFTKGDPSSERWGLWKRDVAEVFLNPRPERAPRYYEFEVSPDNRWLDLDIARDTSPPTHDATWNSGFEHATRVNPRQRVWTCEMRIPFSALNPQEPSFGTIWRVNLFRASGSGSEARRQLMAWSAIPGSKTFHVPSRFGELKFVR